MVFAPPQEKPPQWLLELKRLSEPLAQNRVPTWAYDWINQALKEWRRPGLAQDLCNGTVDPAEVEDRLRAIPLLNAMLPLWQEMVGKIAATRTWDMGGPSVYRETWLVKAVDYAALHREHEDSVKNLCLQHIDYWDNTLDRRLHYPSNTLLAGMVDHSAWLCLHPTPHTLVLHRAMACLDAPDAHYGTWQAAETLQYLSARFPLWLNDIRQLHALHVALEGLPFDKPDEIKRGSLVMHWLKQSNASICALPTIEPNV